MGRLLPRYLAVGCCVAFLLLILLGLVGSYARPVMHVRVSQNSFWAVASTTGHLHWVSYHLHRDETSFAGIELKENALTCELRVAPQQDVHATEVASSAAVAPLHINVDFPLIGRYFPQWSNIAIPFGDPGSEDTTAPIAEVIQEMAVPYWCPLLIAITGIWASTISLRGALRRLRLARIGRCRRCGHELGPIPDRCPECGIPILA
jgi:hypothetical protein